ncbi:PIR protein [Plasmodium yoelii]|uniref:PIR protein n=2 Tax=Plasmodium yoelii TaxID=5861 RepID=A0AAE9WLB7_PLAYO|nr:PIR protein [Plasmodium yoelii]WBY54635.1 PIR protein [Plasmodium yoelii yoelii]VTZ71629.1 PIR protein [Plasmodium yoelii]|eukprot:XP_022810930.1 PIR protein [Plasmodium yoelii]
MGELRMCELFLEADKFFKGNVSAHRQITKSANFRDYCTNQKKCATKIETIGALGEALSMKLHDKENTYSDHVVLWLANKLFDAIKEKEKDNASKITLSSAYDKYLKKYMAHFKYWNSLYNIRGLEDGNLRHLRELYTLLSHICNTIVDYKKNGALSKTLSHNSTYCFNQYISLYKAFPECNSYLYLLNKLKKIYDDIRTSAIENNSSIKNFDKRFRELKMPGVKDSYSMETFKRFNFSASECKVKTTNNIPTVRNAPVKHTTIQRSKIQRGGQSIQKITPKNKDDSLNVSGPESQPKQNITFPKPGDSLLKDEPQSLKGGSDGPGIQKSPTGQENPTGKENTTGKENLTGKESPTDQKISNGQEIPTSKEIPTGQENPNGQENPSGHKISNGQESPDNGKIDQSNELETNQGKTQMSQSPEGNHDGFDFPNLEEYEKLFKTYIEEYKNSVTSSLKDIQEHLYEDIWLPLYETYSTYADYYKNFNIMEYLKGMQGNEPKTAETLDDKSPSTDNGLENPPSLSDNGTSDGEKQKAQDPQIQGPQTEDTKTEDTQTQMSGDQGNGHSQELLSTPENGSTNSEQEKNSDTPSKEQLQSSDGYTNIMSSIGVETRAIRVDVEKGTYEIGFPGNLFKGDNIVAYLITVISILVILAFMYKYFAFGRRKKAKKKKKMKKVLKLCDENNIEKLKCIHRK